VLVFWKQRTLLNPTSEHLRTGCDLFILSFAFDEYSDTQPENAVRAMVDIIVDALSNPSKSRPSGEFILGEVTRQYVNTACIALNGR
jgi:hypothetical protein